MKKGKETHQKKQPSGQGKKTVITEILLAALFICAVGYIGYTLLGRSGKTRTDLPVLENKIRQIQELAVVNQVYRDVIYIKSGTVFTSEILFTIEYNIIAGVDLRKGFSLNEEDGIVTVELPPAEILSIDADDTTINQIFIRETFRPVRQSDYMEYIISEKEILRQAAVDSGILIRAGNNAEKIIEKIILLSGYEQVFFIHDRNGTGGEQDEN
jgi:hypothetical protein